MDRPLAPPSAEPIEEEGLKKKKKKAKKSKKDEAYKPTGTN